MSRFTDIFIRRPVLATVISLLILFIGLHSLFTMQVSEYPAMTNTVITVTTSYPGADAATVQGYITTPLEQSIAAADGIDYFTSTTTDSQSIITIYVTLNYSPDSAFTNVLSQVQQQENQLPSEALTPVISQSTGSSVALLYLGYTSKSMSAGQITAYLTDVVQPQIETVSGVASANILGGNTYAMRIWLDTAKMTAMGVTPSDVSNALQANNYQSSGGNVKGKYVEMNVSASTTLTDVDQFKNLVVTTGSSGQLVYLHDVATVELGAENYSSSVTFNNSPSVALAVDATSTANPLTVINDVKKLLPGLKAQYPSSLNSTIVYDSTTYIKDSISEVVTTIVEAGIIVTLVMLLFLGSIRAVFVPVVTLPLSLVGVFLLMSLLGFSINLMTLLALVLAIGLVVDDAIVVLENTYRLIEEGNEPFDAALIGAREIAGPVISMTITLVAVYAPVGLMGGVTGALFTQFAFTLAGAVVISGIIALTLSPMMCSKVLNKNIGDSWFVQRVDRVFFAAKTRYQAMLKGVLDHKPAIIFLGFVVLVSNLFLFTLTPSELSPTEDEGVLLVTGTAPQSTNINYMEKFTSLLIDYYKPYPAYDSSFVVNGSSGEQSMISLMLLKPWSERTQTEDEVYRALAKKIRNLAGLQIIPVELSSLPTSTGTYPVEFVITTVGSSQDLYETSEKIRKEALASGKFLFLINSMSYDKPKYTMEIDSQKAAQLGITMQDISNLLSPSLSENYIGYFTMFDRSYEVIPQLSNPDRWTPEDLANINIATASGLVPLSTIFSYQHSTTTNNLSRFNQINSATLQGVPMPLLVSTGQAATYLQQLAQRVLPSNYNYDFAGDLRTYVEEGNALMYTFLFAFLIIYLVLAAQFESFKDPLVILTSVPMATCGALIPLCLGLSTINIYSEIGLITLIGLISKHGILMVEFAKQLREEKGYDMRQAIEEAAAIRLRPVLMTTAAMVLGVAPLLFATGAGAVSRFDIGITIVCGMLFGTLFTLFMVPTMYTLSAKKIIAFWVLAIIVSAILMMFV